MLTKGWVDQWPVDHWSQQKFIITSSSSSIIFFLCLSATYFLIKTTVSLDFNKDKIKWYFEVYIQSLPFIQQNTNSNDLLASLRP